MAEAIRRPLGRTLRVRPSAPGFSRLRVRQRTELKRPTFERETRFKNRLDQQVGCNPLVRPVPPKPSLTREWGMEGKGQVTEGCHGLSVTKNLNNCVSIQVR